VHIILSPGGNVQVSVGKLQLLVPGNLLTDDAAS